MKNKEERRDKMSEKKIQEEINEKEEIKDNKEMVSKEDYDELEDRYKRILAEFENFKKRSGKEREGLYNSILSDVVEVILPVLDNLENAEKVETQDEEYKKGIELVLKQFKDVLASKGIEEIKTVGETFDPELHEAVSSIQDEKLGAQEIAKEYRKGYKIGNRVIRHSMVVVAN
jgi:molecular chaperone GrpE